jgi:hypothetical protein
VVSRQAAKAGISLLCVCNINLYKHKICVSKSNLHMCINNYNLGYVMYGSEGKKYQCIKTSKNTKVKNDRKIRVKTKDRESKKIRKKAKRWKCKTGNKPVKAVGRKITKIIKAIGYHRNSEPDPIRKHKYACTVCMTQCVQEYCTNTAYTPVSSGSKCKQEQVVEYIGMSAYMKNRRNSVVCQKRRKYWSVMEKSVWLCRITSIYYVHWQYLKASVDNTKCNGGGKMYSMYGSSGRERCVKNIKYRVERIQYLSESIGMSRVRRESEEMDQDELPPVVNQQLMQQSKPGEYVLSGHSNHVISNLNMLFLTVCCSSRNNNTKCVPIMLFLLVSKPYICSVAKHVHINLCLFVISGVGKHAVTEYYRANNWHKRYGE